MTGPTTTRQYGVGGEIVAGRCVSLRVWAPDRGTVAVVMDGHAATLERDADGWHSAVVAGGPGSRYGFLLTASILCVTIWMNR